MPKRRIRKISHQAGFGVVSLALLINVIGWVIPLYFWWSISWLFSLATLVLFIIGIMNAINGKKEPLPIIGGLADMFKF